MTDNKKRALDKRIAELERLIDIRVGADRLHWGLPVRKRPFNKKRFIKLAGELQQFDRERENERYSPDSIYSARQ